MELNAFFAMNAQKLVQQRRCTRENGFVVMKQGNDIVNIGLHFFHKDVRPYAASCNEV